MTDRANVRVLLVEDNPGDARLVEILLSEAGPSPAFEVTHVERFAEALDRLGGAEFDVILLDLSLPDSSGLETVERARATAPRTPLVVLSGQDDEETALQAIQGGAEDYLVKDQGDGELMARSIRYAIERKKTEEKYRSIFENAIDGIFQTSPDGRLLTANPALARIFGYGSPEEMLRSVTDLARQLYADPNRRAEFVRLLQEQNAVSGFEAEGRRRDGSLIWFSANARAIRDDAGNLVGFEGTVEDVTERKRTEEKLAERERELKELVGKLITAQEEERRRVAYEVHDGPTQVAIAAHQHFQAFADNHPAGSEVKEGELDRALELAQQAVKESRRIIESLRPTALDDSGLATAIRQQIEDLENEGWEIDCEETLGEERLSPEVETALFRVAQEALTNVKKHARTTKAHVKLVRLGPGKVRLEVRDEGSGFDPQAVSSGDGGGPGERVGLAGMRERVALLGGELEIESKPGEGTSIVAEVPLPGASEGKAAERYGK